ncbi:MAG: S1 RNA-binding domain-containing protein [Chloroflexota bacterium]
MSTTPSMDPTPPPKDEEYWQALFQQEESIAPSPVPQAGEAPPAAHLYLNGRLATPPTFPKREVDPWYTAQETYNNDESLVLPVSGYNKGGLLVYWQGLQGFVPASQLIDFSQFHMTQDRASVLKNWLNQELTLKIIEVNRATNRLIFSERAALVAADERETLFKQLMPGDMVEGEVTNLTDFGAFVDIGGVEGLIHISELSWSRVTHPSQVVSPHQAVKVKVLEVHAEEGRVALSRKRLHPNPWQDVEARYTPGQIVTGVVSNVVNFGAFVQLEEELEGLIHISELAEGTFLHPRNVVQKGETVRAKVLHVDGSDKRLALSMRGVDLGHS